MNYRNVHGYQRRMSPMMKRRLAVASIIIVLLLFLLLCSVLGIVSVIWFIQWLATV